MSDSRPIGTAAVDLGGIEGGRVRLDLFDASKLDRGRPRWIEAAWFVVQWLFVASFLPGSSTRSALLRLFGTRIGKGVMIKPRMRVKSRRRLRSHDWSLPTFASVVRTMVVAMHMPRGGPKALRLIAAGTGQIANPFSRRRISAIFRTIMYS